MRGVRSIGGRGVVSLGHHGGMSWNLGDMIERVEAAVSPGRIALAHGERTVDWGTLRGQSNALARALVAGGLQVGERVAFYAYNAPEYLIALLACWKARGCHVNVNYRYVADELAHILIDSDATVLVYDARLRDAVAAVVARAPMIRTYVEIGGDDATPAFADRFDDLIAGVDDTPLGLARDPDDLFFLYTGGTTGLPKGVVWRQRDVNAIGLAAMALQGVPQPASLDAAAAAAAGATYPRTLCIPPLMHGTGLLAAYNALLAGGFVAMLPGTGFRAEDVLDTAERWWADRLIVVGDAFARPILDALNAHPGRWDVSSVRWIISSGAMWTEGVKQGLIAHMPDMACIDAFSSSEAMGMGGSLTTRDSVAATATFRAGAHCRVLDADDRDVAPGSGATGMVVLGPPTPVGYHKDPDKSARTFRTIDGVRYTVSGDFAQVAADGALVLLGRGSACINSAGEKIFPEEVEEALKLSAGVDDALVFGVPDPKWGQAVAAVVQRGADYDEASVRAALRARLAGYKQPKLLVATEASLRAPNGKADYAKAKALAGVA